MKYGELKRKLRKAGCQFYREGGRHEIWINPKTGVTFALSRHDHEEEATGTLNRILKDCGLK